MKLTPSKILVVYKFIGEITECPLPYKAARRINKLKKQICNEFETILKAESDLVRSYGGVAAKGSYTFPDQTSADEFRDRYKSFMEEEDDFDIEVVDLSKCIDMINISSNAIDALGGLVYFGEE